MKQVSGMPGARWQAWTPALTHAGTLVRHETDQDALAGHVAGAGAVIATDAASRVLCAERGRLGAAAVFRREAGGEVRYAFHPASLYEGDRPQLSRLGVAQFLTFQFVPPPWTVLEGVEKLAAGESRLEIVGAGHSAQVKPLIDFRKSQDGGQGEDQGAAGGRHDDALPVLAAIFDSLLDHLEAPVISLTSGGVDSSTNAFFLSKLPIETRLLTAGFADGRYDESRYASALADGLGLPHDIELITGPDPRWLDLAAEHLVEPIGDRAIIPTLALLAARSGGAQSLVSGEGGDEVWGPPRRFFDVAPSDPSSVGTISAYVDRIACCSVEQCGLLLRDARLARDARAAAVAEFARHAERAGATDTFQRAKTVQCIGWLAENVVQKDVAAGRMLGLKSHFPLADHRAAEFIGQLTPARHQELCADKAALKALLSAAGVTAWKRPKHKFKTPPAVWGGVALQSRLQAAIRSGQSPLAGLIDEQAFAALDPDHRLVFALALLDRWFTRLCASVEARSKAGRTGVAAPSAAAIKLRPCAA